MALEHRPWIVRVPAYVGTGILILLLAALTLVTVASLVWALTAGPQWLHWTVGAPLLLILLTLVGRSFYRKEF